MTIASCFIVEWFFFNVFTRIINWKFIRYRIDVYDIAVSRIHAYIYINNRDRRSRLAWEWFDGAVVAAAAAARHSRAVAYSEGLYWVKEGRPSRLSRATLSLARYCSSQRFYVTAAQQQFILASLFFPFECTRRETLVVLFRAMDVVDFSTDRSSCGWFFCFRYTDRSIHLQ